MNIICHIFTCVWWTLNLNKDLKNTLSGIAQASLVDQGWKPYVEVSGDDLDGQKDDDGEPVEDVVHGRGRERQTELVAVADLTREQEL